MMVVLSSSTGFCEAVLLDNGYLTDLRTGLAGAVAARHLARGNISTVGVVGAGAQARYQVECLTLVREFDKLLVLGRDRERQATYIDEMQRKLGITVAAAKSMEQLVRESDLVVTTTSSRTPLIRADWLHPGLHITAMGSDLAGKQELDAGVPAAADLLVCDRKSQCFSMGELQHGLVAGILTEDSPVLELGDLTGARTAGRSSDRQVTVCDLTGTGVQDTAIATVAYEAAVSRGIGTVISN
jgi:ornithine cyclodeaminase